VRESTGPAREGLRALSKLNACAEGAIYASSSFRLSGLATTILYVATRRSKQAPPSIPTAREQMEQAPEEFRQISISSSYDRTVIHIYCLLILQKESNIPMTENFSRALS